MSNVGLELRTKSRFGKLRSLAQLASNDVNARDIATPSTSEIKRWRKLGSEALESDLGEDVETEVNETDRNSRANLGWAALHLACQFGHIDVVRLLIENGADANVTNRFGETPLHSLFLVENPERRSAWNDSDRRKILDLLIENGANLNAEDENGSRPLNLAIRLPEASDLTFPMVASGAKINHQSKLKPNDWLLGCQLRLAVYEGDLPSAKKLIKAGADPSAQDKYRLERNKDRNLLKATSSPELEYMLGKDVHCDLEPPAHNRACLAWSPLHLACLAGHFKMSELLLGAGANPNAVNVGGETPLHALFLEHDEDLPDSFAEDVRYKMLEQLLTSGVEVDATDFKHFTPLSWACWRPNAFECVKLLLDAGADPTTKTRCGYSPLHICAAVGAIESAKLLLETGRVNANRKLNRETAMDIAKREKQIDFQDFLASVIAKQRQ